MSLKRIQITMTEKRLISNPEKSIYCIVWKLPSTSRDQLIGNFSEFYSHLVDLITG